MKRPMVVKAGSKAQALASTTIKWWDIIDMNQKSHVPVIGRDCEFRSSKPYLIIISSMLVRKCLHHLRERNCLYTVGFHPISATLLLPSSSISFEFTFDSLFPFFLVGISPTIPAKFVAGNGPAIPVYNDCYSQSSPRRPDQRRPSLSDNSPDFGFIPVHKRVRITNLLIHARFNVTLRECIRTYPGKIR